MRALILAALCFLLVFSLACAGWGRAENVPEDPLVVPIGDADQVWGMGDLIPGTPGGSLVVAAPDLPGTFNHLVADETHSLDITEQLNEGLTDFSPATGRITPALARSWEVADDGRTYVFHLREGLKFSDGEPLTAEDVLFTFEELIFNEGVQSDFRDILTVEGELPDIEKLDDYTVKFKTPAVFPPFLRRVGVPIYPKHRCGELTPQEFNSLWGHETARKSPEQIVGAGPYRVKELIPGEKLTLERNPYYFKVDPTGTQLPYLDQWSVVPAEDREVSLLKFKTNQTDLFNGNLRELPFLLRNSEVENWNVIVREGFEGAPESSDFLVFNWDAADEVLAELFGEVKFREAISHSINRREIVNGVFNGLARIQSSPLAELSPYYNPDAGDAYPAEYDLEKARKLLDELGLEDADGDDIRDLPGAGELSFEIITNKDNPRRKRMAEIIARNLREVGIEVELALLDFDTLIRRLLSGRFEGALAGLFADPLEPSGLRDPYHSTSDLHFWHLAASQSPTEAEGKIDSLLEEGEAAVGLDARKPIYDELQMLITKTVPVIYTAAPVYTYAHTKSLRNTETFNNLGSFLGHSEYVWIENR